MHFFIFLFTIIRLARFNIMQMEIIIKLNGLAREKWVNCLRDITCHVANHKRVHKILADEQPVNLLD